MSKYSDNLKSDLKKSAIRHANSKECKFIVRESAIIFDDIKDPFNKDSYSNIQENDNWKQRLNKDHSQVKGAKEMQSSNSSDALLMNIFCHPKLKQWKGVSDLFEEKIEEVQFGINPKNLSKDGKKEKPLTEIDMVINNRIYVEAKLTESNFTQVEVEKMKKYNLFQEVFDFNTLPKRNNKFDHFQLLRNILAAKADNTRFILICDARRPDLIHHLFEVVKCIKDEDLRYRCSFLCWQDIARKCGADLQSFLDIKYGII